MAGLWKYSMGGYGRIGVHREAYMCMNKCFSYLDDGLGRPVGEGERHQDGHVVDPPQRVLQGGQFEPVGHK